MPSLTIVADYVKVPSVKEDKKEPEKSKCDISDKLHKNEEESCKKYHHTK